ncbi:unnamed protein product [Somion occarium]|uniref:G-alpha-domain-containing protein n=1 Tax=Somion occarium TaxID=3059160 RepID=A0ABP1DLK3_9APHY
MPAREAPVPVIGQFSSDPLDALLRPPIDETDEEKAYRLAQESEAKRISQAIDDGIRQERLQRKKAKVVRLLLLGQSESGKSTTLRQFQRIYTPSAFREERILWRSVIQLNLVRSIRIILDAIQDVRRHELQPTSDDEYDDDYPDQRVCLPPHLEALCMQLLPLRHVESLLIAKLVPPNEDEATHLGLHHDGSHSHRQHEIFVRPGMSWKGTMRRYGRPNSIGTVGQETQDESQAVIHECAMEMMALWEDRTVKEILKKRKIRLEESPGFYLNDLERITSPHYLPSEDDVLKARLKTVGVSEYRFQMESGTESGTEWRIIDVGGSRSQRQTWIPFFDDAIIFLAPISGFDQTLVEDRSVNRLEDSVLLWKAICSNKLLAKVDLVLFLNKCDILASKLKSGIRLAKYVRSFGERPNDAETAEKYFRSKFNAIHREHSPIPRKFYGFCTSVTDTTTTMGILASVRDMVVREHLRASRLL